MTLTIQNLAIPRKQPVTRKTATYTRGYTPETYHIISGNMTLTNPLTPSDPTIKYYPRIYEGKPPDALPSENYLCYAEVYANRSSTQDTRIADLTKGRLLYKVAPSGQTIDSYDRLVIECARPDGTTFTINPGAGLSSGLYCVGIRFMNFQWQDYTGSVHTLGSAEGIAPRTRETRTTDNITFEVALAPEMFRITVEIDVYSASRQEIVRQETVANLDNYSSYGRGGLYYYWVCAGVNYKDKNAAQLDPSGEWYTEDKSIKTDIDVQVSWT